jgi:hypothetical protein
MDDIITEPLGGAHAEPMGSFPAIKESIMDIYYRKCVHFAHPEEFRVTLPHPACSCAQEISVNCTVMLAAPSSKEGTV